MLEEAGLAFVEDLGPEQWVQLEDAEREAPHHDGALTPWLDAIDGTPLQDELLALPVEVTDQRLKRVRAGRHGKG